MAQADKFRDSSEARESPQAHEKADRHFVTEREVGAEEKDGRKQGKDYVGKEEKGCVNQFRFS
jgi:hypothetical protein